MEARPAAEPIVLASPSRYALNVAGGAARVFTTLHELDDRLALTSVVSSLLQNLVLVIQIVSLGPPPSSGPGGRRLKKKV